jgi:hypothetical protein
MPIRVIPHPLGVVLKTQLPPGDRDVLGNVSELLIDGDMFGGLTYSQIVKLAKLHGGNIYERELKVE